jgi:hypothetical protein
MWSRIRATIRATLVWRHRQGGGFVHSAASRSRIAIDSKPQLTIDAFLIHRKDREDVLPRSTAASES